MKKPQIRNLLLLVIATVKFTSCEAYNDYDPVIE